MGVIYHQAGRDAHYKIWNAPVEDMIIYFHKGAGSLVFQDAIYPIEDGGICFIKGGKLRYTMPDNPAEYDRSKLYLERDKANRILSALDPDGEFYKLFSESSVVYARLSGKACSIADAYFRSVQENSVKNMRESSEILAFFALLCLVFEYKKQRIAAPLGEMARVVEYINTHYAERPSLDSICRAVNISKSHLCRRFKKALGITVSDYVLNTRLAAAKAKLISSDLSISEISEDCGFSSTSYFCQAFRAMEGQSAREYRKKHLNKA